jgi:hypothetical protein
MKDHDIIKEFEGKNVEVITVDRTFSGTLKFDVGRKLLSVSPATKSRYGTAIIDQDYVVAIREILPQPVVQSTSEAKYDGEDDCDKSESEG